MKKNKIIFINKRTYGSEFPDEKDNNFFLWGMGHFFCWELLKKDYNIEVENWRTDRTINETKEKNVDGIYCRVFPSNTLLNIKEFSYKLIKALQHEMKHNNVIIHFMAIYDIFYDLLVYKFRNYPIVATHLANTHFRWYGGIKSILKSEIEERFSLKYHDHIFCTTDTEKNYLEKIIDDRVSKEPIYGFDMNIFSISNKIEARKRLGLPLDKKIILQVGRAYYARGIHILLDAWKVLKKDSNNLLLFVGVQEVEELYSEIVKSGALYRGFMDYNELPLYYNAADVLVYIPFGKMDLNSGGTGYVPLESLACGTPVICTSLRHFPDNKINEVSRIPQKEEDVLPMIIDLLNNPPLSQDCRDIVKKYYSWDSVLPSILLIYKKLFSKYYNLELIN